MRYAWSRVTCTYSVTHNQTDAGGGDGFVQQTNILGVLKVHPLRPIYFSFPITGTPEPEHSGNSEFWVEFLRHKTVEPQKCHNELSWQSTWLNKEKLRPRLIIILLYNCVDKRGTPTLHVILYTCFIFIKGCPHWDPLLQCDVMNDSNTDRHSKWMCKRKTCTQTLMWSYFLELTHLLLGVNGSLGLVALL